MLEIELELPPDTDLTHAELTVESVCAAEGLRPALKDTLKKYPGCIHWHYQQAGQRGTLEITLWPDKRRLWFKVAARRQADWIGEAIARLKPAIESGLIFGDQGL
jgi:hypothetical protein